MEADEAAVDSSARSIHNCAIGGAADRVLRLLPERVDRDRQSLCNEQAALNRRRRLARLFSNARSKRLTLRKVDFTQGCTHIGLRNSRRLFQLLRGYVEQTGSLVSKPSYLSVQLRESAPYLKDAGWRQTAT